jgi:CBS domain-containing protein
MQHRTVSDVMTHQVATVRRDTSFKAIATLLAERDVSAVLVVDDVGRVLGVVSEGDLLRKESSQREPEGHRTQRWIRPGSRKRSRAENAATPADVEPRVEVGADHTTTADGRTRTAHAHAGDAEEHQPSHVSGLADPVCGMPLTPDTAAEYRDTPDGTRYFCSAACAAAFDADPSHYKTTEGM